MCGATQQQKDIQGQQSGFYNQMTQQASQIFGQTSQVFQNLVNTFSPVVAAGPNQYGFNAQEDQNMRSQAITATGQSYKNEKQALGDQIAAQGGGTAVLPGGASVGAQAQLAENAGNETANQLSNITQAGYAQGNKNWLSAAQGLAGAPGVFGASDSANNVAIGSGTSAADSANQVATAANSPWNAVIGAAGAVAGQAAGAYAGKG